LKVPSRILVPAVLVVALFAVAGCKKKQPPLPVETAPPPPTVQAPTAQITATPSVVSAGDQVVLSWRTADATTVTLEGIGDVPSSGVKTVTPTASTSYHLIATGAGGTADATARVTVNAPPAVVVPTNTMSVEEEFKANVQDAFFDYDTYDVRSDAQGVLAKDASFLVSHPDIKVVIGATATSAGQTSITSPWARTARTQRRTRWFPEGCRQPHPRGQLRKREAILLGVDRGVLAAEPPRGVHPRPVNGR